MSSIHIAKHTMVKENILMTKKKFLPLWNVGDENMIEKMNKH